MTAGQPCCLAASTAGSTPFTGRTLPSSANSPSSTVFSRRCQGFFRPADITAIAHDAGVTVEVIISTSWDCPFDGPTPPQRVLDIVDAACEFGADRLAIADTIGTATPGRVTSLVAQVRPRIGDRPLGAHFHNTRGTGLASAWAAVSAGVTRLDSSIGGLGGCPFAPGASGNIATEDLVYLLRDSGVGVDVDLDAAIEAARVARTAVGHDLPSALLRAGDRIRG